MKRSHKSIPVKKGALLFLALFLLFSFLSSGLHASDGLDRNKKAFGPKVKGFQLGTAVSMQDFLKNCRQISSRPSYTVVVLTYDENMKCNGTLAMWIDVDKWEIWHQSGDKESSKFFMGNPVDRMVYYDTFEHIDTSQNFGNYFEAVIAEAEKHPAAEIQFWGGSDYFDASAIRKPGQKIFRYDHFKFGEHIFNAENMTSEAFVEAVMKNYSLGKLVSTFYVNGLMGGVGTPSEDALKKGWRADVNSFLKAMVLSVVTEDDKKAIFD